MIIIEKKEEIIMKELNLINSLIQEESDIVKSYEHYLKDNPKGNFNYGVQQKISRHNNHIQALKNIVGR